MDNVESIDKSEIKKEIFHSKDLVETNDLEDSREYTEDTLEEDKIRYISEDIHYNIMEYVRRQGLCIAEYLSVDDISNFIIENKH